MKHQPTVPCKCREFHIPWEQAFDKFGFDDGQYSQTINIVIALEEAGYAVHSETWGWHNEVIFSIKHDGKELMPVNDPDITIGYSDPRDYLPDEISQLLDETFG